MKNHGFKSVFEVCAALLAQYIAFYMISSRLGKEAEIENFLTNKFVMIFWVKYSLQGTTQGNGLTGGVPPVRFSM